MKQFVGDNKQKVIVPRLIGMTETARDVKRPPNRTMTKWDEFNSKCTPEMSKFYRHVLDIADEHGHTIYWGTFGFSIRVSLRDTTASIAYVYTPNIFQIYFAHLPWPVEQISALRKEILEFKVYKESPKTLTAHLKADNIQ